MTCNWQLTGPWSEQCTPLVPFANCWHRGLWVAPGMSRDWFSYNYGLSGPRTAVHCQGGGQAKEGMNENPQIKKGEGGEGENEIEIDRARARWGRGEEVGEREKERRERGRRGGGEMRTMEIRTRKEGGREYNTFRCYFWSLTINSWKGHVPRPDSPQICSESCVVLIGVLWGEGIFFNGGEMFYGSIHLGNVWFNRFLHCIPPQNFQ